MTGLHSFISIFSPATWFLLLSMLLFIALIAEASISKSSRLNWEDMLIDPVTKKMSITRLGQMIGIIIGSWVIITLVDTNHDISFDVFATYLAFLVGAFGINNYFSRKLPGDSTPGNDHQKQD